MLKKAFVITALAAAASLFAADKLNGAGASFPAPIYYDWAHSYQAKTSNQINYQSIGSGGGIKQVSSRTVDFGGSDKPLKPAELDKDKLLQFPAVIGTINVVYNLPGIKDEELKLSNDAVDGIFLGTIQFWDDAKIKKDNAGLALPHTRVTVVHRSDGSGTTYNFTYWLNEVSSTWKAKIGTGTSVNWPVGIGGKGNEGVANVVKQTPGSIGYVESAYAKSNGLTSSQLQTKDGNFIPWTIKAAKAAAANAKWTKKDHFYEILVLEPGKNSWPITAGTFILMPKEKAAENKKVTAFFKYAFAEGDAAAEKQGYVPLPNETVKLVEEYWKENGVNP